MNHSHQHSEAVELIVEGMNCSSCALSVERALSQLGAENPVVNFATSTARFGLGSSLSLVDVKTRIESLGYRVIGNPIESNFLHQLQLKFLICLIFTLPLLLHMFWSLRILHDPVFQLLMCLPVFVIGFNHFGRSALGSLKAGTTNMDVLIVIGITSAFFYSLLGLVLNLGPNYLFFETSASITTLVLLGNVLEHRSIKFTGSALEELGRIQAPVARKIELNGAQEIVTEILVGEVSVGDSLLVNTGDKIPVDGQIDWGEVSLDESMLSGESIPVDRTIGDSVVGGTLVLSGSIKIRASAVGQDTVLSRMIALVKDAQTRKPPIQRFGDRVSNVFVPTVIVLALLTVGLGIWGFQVSLQEALLRAIAVLVIACPCAMGLATPTAVMVGIGRAAKLGILIRGGDSIEALAGIKTVVFDKTGTLTTGKFKIRDLKLIGISTEEAAEIIVKLEQHSSHPIAQSLVKELSSRYPKHSKIEFIQVEEKRGLGMSAKDNFGNTYLIGSAGLLRANGINAGSSDIYVIRNGEIVTEIAIEDALKPETASVIQMLESSGIRTILLSGDKTETCHQVAEKLGIKTVFAQKNPAEKLSIIDQLSRTEPIAFVGDGINDAAALAGASIGISLSGATQAAISSAQVVLLSDNLKRLIDALSLSKLTLRTIKQNLFWAFIYNCLAIPLAGIGYLSPIVAAFAMAMSDVFVIGNSIRLKFRKIAEFGSYSE